MIVKAYPGIPLYGDSKYRNKQCAHEEIEQITFVNSIRSQYPYSYGLILVHPENEGKLINGQFTRITRSKAMGMNKGAADILIPGMPSFVCEIKRQDRTLSQLDAHQHAYLKASWDAGSFVCIALGHQAAENAFRDWLKLQVKSPHRF